MMKKLTVLFIASSVCSMLNCVMHAVEINWSAAAGWFTASCAIFLLFRILRGWNGPKARYEAEISRYKRDLEESLKRERIAVAAVATHERALGKQAEEIAALKEKLAALTQWRDIPAGPKREFATKEALEEIFCDLPRLVRDRRDGCIELIDYDNTQEWRGDLERKPSRYQWRKIGE